MIVNQTFGLGFGGIAGKIALQIMRLPLIYQFKIMLLI
jgi:ABC-type phosphate transport system permease subunit